MATPTTPPTTAKVTTSTDPLYKLALAQAQASLAAEQAPVKSEQAASDAYYKQRSTDAGTNAAALSELLKGIGPKIGGTYEQAAQNQTLAANGFSHGMQDALQGNTDNLNAMLDKLGSPANLDSHAAEAGDVVYGLGGYYPAAQDRTTGAALESAADMLPGTALLHGQETQKQIGIQSMSAHSALDNKLADMAGSLPGDVQANYAKLQTLALSNARFREQVSKDKFDQAYKTAQQKLNIAKYNTDVDYKNATLQLRGQALDLQAQKFARQQFQQDREYGLAMQRLGISSKSLQLRIAAQEFKAANGGLSASALTKAQGFVTALAASISTVEQADGQKHLLVNNAKPGKPANWVPATYLGFVGQAARHGVPLSMAIERANDVFPLVDRPPADALAKITGLSQAAAFQATGPAGGAGPKQNKLLDIAKLQLGIPYVWGGATPGKALDCSGFVQCVFKAVGVNLPRTTYEQVKKGKPVALNAIKPGDAIFTEPSKDGPGHVGLYIGNNQVQESPHTGDVNKIIDLNSFLSGGFVAARRYLP